MSAPSSTDSPNLLSIVPPALGRLQIRGLGCFKQFVNDEVEYALDRFDGKKESAELVVRKLYKAGPANGEKVYQCRVNLVAPTGVSTLTKQLQLAWTNRIPGSLPDFAGHLRILFGEALEYNRQGEPIEQIGYSPHGESETTVFQAPVVVDGERNIIAAAGGQGKTTLIHAMAIAQATGLCVIPGFGKPLSAPCLILDTDTDFKTTQAGIKAIVRGLGLDRVPQGIFYRQLKGPLHHQVEELAAFCDDNAIGPKFLDGTEAAAGNAEGDAFNDRVNRLWDAEGMIGGAWVNADHLAGADLDRETAILKPYGGVFKLNRARAVFALRSESEGTRERREMALIDVKRNFRSKIATLGIAVLFSDFDDNGTARCIRFEATQVEAPELVRAGLPKSEQLARLLTSGPLTVKELAAELGISDAAIRTYMGRSKGRFIRLPDGRVGLGYGGGE